MERDDRVHGTGGHSTGTGITRDIEKGNAAMLAGWRLLRCTGEQVTNGQCVQWIEQAMDRKEAG